MAKKKKPAGKNEAFNELKTLESKWLKDRRVEELQPVQVKVMAAKVAAFIEFVEQNDMNVNVSDWPLVGAEELVKLDENSFKQGISNLQKVGVLNSSLKFKKVADKKVVEIDTESVDGILIYRCIKPGGVNIADRDEYILEDAEVTFTEEDIDKSSSLQAAIANEWLMRIESRQEQGNA
ncbi:MAG TPA: hypothetical protein VEK08_07265 [Planctomycetota bacterium]|nr:hypothetical protein [Planctomycetota bacterium]